MRSFALLFLASLGLFACSSGTPTSPTVTQIPVQIRGASHSSVAVTKDSLGGVKIGRAQDSSAALPSGAVSHDSITGVPVAGVDPTALTP